MPEIASITVKPGDRLTGRYKRASREANSVDMQVEACIVFPSVRGPTAMVVGTNLDLASAFGGQRVGLRTSCFDPRHLTHTEGYEKPTIDPKDIYVTPSSDVFAFIEEVKPEDHEWAEMLGGTALSQLIVDSLQIAVVKETPAT